MNDNNDWDNLPDWAKYYIDIGCVIANYDNAENRLIVGLSTPIRAYATVLISLGMILSKIAASNIDNDRVSHFEHICSLPINTRLLYTRNRLV